MEHPHSEEHGVTVRNTLASICSGTVRKIGHLFHREVPMYLPANLLPSRVSFCFGALDNESQGTALVRSLSDLSRWCSELGVWSILAYDKAGILKRRKSYVKSLLPRGTKLMCCCEGEVGEPVLPYQGDHNAANAQNGYLGRLEVIIMDSEDGRPLLSKVARRIAEDRKSRALNYELLLEYIQKEAQFEVKEPDLVFVFGSQSDRSFELHGYPPWIIGYSEFWLVKTDIPASRKDFLTGILKYSKTVRRHGK